MSKQKIRKKDKYKAVIIGAGRIAAQFDSPQSREILTHAHAYRKHPKIDLAGFFDVNKAAADKAARKWQCGAYYNFGEMFKKVNPDIVSICTPDENHSSALLKTAEYKPRMVICEKPVTANLRETRAIVKLYRGIKVPVLVNYSRRFDETAREARKNISSGRYGKILCASGIYTKGVLHNGSHMIDLCRFLFGEMKECARLHKVGDFTKNDATIAGFLKFEKCGQFYLMAGDERKYSIFELDIICEKKRIRFDDFGLSISTQEVKDDPLFAGFKCLSKPAVRKTSLINAMPALINNAVNYLEKKEELFCDINSAMLTQNACFKLLHNKNN